MRYVTTIVLLALCCLATLSRAELVRQHYPGVRPTGMGGAFLAVSDDNNALWYNPAGLARVRSFHFNLIDLTLGVDSSDTLSRIGNGLFKGQMDQLARNDEQLMRIGIRPTFVAPYFALAVFDRLNGYFDLRAIDAFNIADPTTYNGKIDVFTFNDVGVAAGIGIPMGDAVSIGATVRAFQRTSIEVATTLQDLLTQASVTPTDLQSSAFNTLKKVQGAGLGIGLTLGAMIHVPLPKNYPRWTVAVTAEDVGDTSFRALSASAPPKVGATYHLGTALTYPYKGGNKLTLALDYRNALESFPLVKKLYAGAEYRTKVMGFRAGLHQGYPTAGISIEFPPHTRLHFSTYASETGQALWESSQRWYMLQFVIGFNPI